MDGPERVVGMQLSLLQVRSRRCTCQILRAAGVGQEKGALRWRNTPGEAEPRRGSARQQSAFMSASLMNERSRFAVTPGETGPGAGCFIDSSQPSRRRNKVSVRAGERGENRDASTRIQSGEESTICETMWIKGDSFENT